MLNAGKFNEVKQLLLDEIQALKIKEKVFENQLMKARNFYENLFTIPYESAVTMIDSMEADIEMRALCRLQMQMVKNYMTTEDRTQASYRLEDGIRRLDHELQGVVHSI